MAPNELNPWDQARGRLRAILDQHSFKNWFAPTRFESYRDGELTVSVPSQFFATWLRDHYASEIESSVRACCPDFREIQYNVAKEIGKGRSPEVATSAAPVQSKRNSEFPGTFAGFNPRYTFERFIVGSGNRFAHAAMKAVAEAPARAYNPLFMYGGTGLGKTHLMQALGQEVLRRRPGANVVYLSTEEFTNQLIEAIAKKSTTRFRATYRRADVLLIDDIHFITGKEATQEEFFHTFNTLFDSHKQIVISSDRQPKDIPDLEERLVSRFEWGLVTDVQPPDLETRMAILQKKAIEEGAAAPQEVLHFIASAVTANIRELEGALITVIAYSKLTERGITLEMAQEVLRDLVGRDKVQPITHEMIQRAVAEHFDVRISDLRGRNRQRQVSYPRQIGMFLCKELIPAMSLTEIGEAFGGKDHTTVLYACKKISQEAKQRTEVQRTIGQLERMVRTQTV